MKKTCLVCGKDFVPKKFGYSRRVCYNKSCVHKRRESSRYRLVNGSQMRKSWWSKNADKIAEDRRIKRRALRASVLAHYGGKCACCGEEHQEFLAIDHIHGGGSKHRQEIGSGGTAFYSWLVKNGLPSGFRVLCSNCNQSIGAYGYCPHQKGE